ncbi:hypothetical protein CYMTET_44876 [Cymbomonas tetramitiformis]|uniref:Uncharacterized protein n=1 Tax=Cymbomonas tetramitiformis TaxID=36881 RepID=A0AAE0F093_9CHLO|nr:hypothetical protein CYMTET_44876 [Cymbomonas tetramitiformis]
MLSYSASDQALAIPPRELGACASGTPFSTSVASAPIRATDRGTKRRPDPDNDASLLHEDDLRHSKWGRFPPHARLNVDQVPMPFVFHAGRCDTYEFKGAKRVQVSGNGGGSMSKRQATAQLAFRPIRAIRKKDGSIVELPQPRPAMVFRGKGRVKQEEILAYNPNVDVYWQDNAWVDRVVAPAWAKRTMMQFAKNDAAVFAKAGLGDLVPTEYLLLQDNLDAQKEETYKQVLLSEVKATSWFGPAQATDLWQPVDQGYGREVKREMDVCQEDWLEDDHNLERWEDNKLATSDKRVCLTHWLGESCETVNSACNLFRYFQKGGLLMTVNGEGDGMITPEGTAGYTFPEPDLAPDAVEMLKSVAEILPERSDSEDEDHCDSDGGAEEYLEGDDETEVAWYLPAGFVVREQFRDPTDANGKKALVGRSIMFFWEGAGWCKGVIKTVLTSSQQAKCAGNYEVLYVDGDKANNLLLHRTYSWGDEAEYGSWVMLQKAVVGEEPKSTCKEVRAMPSEQPQPQELDVHAEGGGEKFSAGARVQDDIFGPATGLYLACTHSVKAGECNSCSRNGTDKAYAVLKFDSGRVGDRRGCEHLSVLQ